MVVVCENNSGQELGADTVGGMLATGELHRPVSGFRIEALVADGLNAEAALKPGVDQVVAAARSLL